MKAVITGASGFCGIHLGHYLQSKGVETVGLQRPTLMGDVSGLAERLRALAPDFVFHLAGMMHAPTPPEFYSVNTLYAVTLLQALREAGLAQIPVLLVGSAAEYGVPLPEHIPLTEEAPVRPATHYGASKLAQSLLGQTVARNEKRPIVIARPFNIIGPGMPSHLVIQNFAEQIARVKRGDSPPVMETGNLESRRDFLDVDDLVRMYWELIRNPDAHGEIVNICTGQGTKISDILHQLIARAKIDIQVKLDPARLRGSDSPLNVGSTRKLASLVNTPAITPLATSLDKICAAVGF